MRIEICNNCGAQILISDEEEKKIKSQLPDDIDFDQVRFFCRDYDSENEICNGENAEQAIEDNDMLPYYEY